MRFHTESLKKVITSSCPTLEWCNFVNAINIHVILQHHSTIFNFLFQNHIKPDHQGSHDYSNYSVTDWDDNWYDWIKNWCDYFEDWYNEWFEDWDDDCDQDLDDDCNEDLDDDCDEDSNYDCDEDWDNDAVKNDGQNKAMDMPPKDKLSVCTCGKAKVFTPPGM